MLFPLPALLFSPAVAKQQRDAETVKMNIRTKALHDKSIYTGERHQGFLYFSLKDVMAGNGTAHIRTQFGTLVTEDTYTFEFDIDTVKIKHRIDRINKEAEGQK